METGKLLLIITASLLLIGACAGKEPNTDTDSSQITSDPAKPVDVTLMEAFTEEFDAQVSDLFVFQKLNTRPDFRYYPGFPSLSESGKRILMLRLDPKDTAGEGAFAGAVGYVGHGTLSVRMRTPDITSVQSSVGSCALLSLYDPDGDERITLSLRLSEPSKVYLSVCGKESSYTPAISGFKASSQFFVYGFDWAEGKLSAWIMDETEANKEVLAEFSGNLLDTPLHPALRFFTPKTGELPLYPYELEIDWIKYTPAG